METFNITQAELGRKLEMNKGGLHTALKGGTASFNPKTIRNLVSKFNVNPMIFFDEAAEPDFLPANKDFDELKMLRKKVKEYETIIDKLIKLREGK